MSLVRDETAAITEQSESGKWRVPWSGIVAAVVMPVPFFLVSGFFFGTIEGDIPWPATGRDELIYTTSDAFLWVGVAIGLVSLVFCATFPRRIPLRFRLANVGIATVLFALAACATFFGAYAFGHENFLFAFTR